MKTDNKSIKYIIKKGFIYDITAILKRFINNDDRCTSNFDNILYKLKLLDIEKIWYILNTHNISELNNKIFKYNKYGEFVLDNTFSEIIKIYDYKTNKESIKNEIVIRKIILLLESNCNKELFYKINRTCNLYDTLKLITKNYNLCNYLINIYKNPESLDYYINKIIYLICAETSHDSPQIGEMPK